MTTSGRDGAAEAGPGLGTPAPDSRFKPGSTLYALGSPAYRALWLNASLMLTALHLGFATHNVVAYDITGRNSAVGFVAFGIGFAILFSTPFAGAIADRMSKRLLLFLTESAVLVMAVMLSSLLLADALTIGLMLPGVILFGAGVAFFWPAITACMGENVEPERQANGAALFQIALNLTRSFAPFVGAGLVAWQVTGFTGAYVAVGVVTLGTIATIAYVPSPLPAAPDAVATPRIGMLDEMRLGLRHVLETRRLLESLVSFIVVILLAFSIMVILPAFAKDVLDAGNAGFGIMFGTHAVGGLFAGLFVASRTSSGDLRRSLFVSSLAVGLMISVLSFMPNFALGLVAVFFVGAAAGAFQTLVMAAILRAARPAYFGRVVALTNLGWALTNLVGLMFGILADASSERTALFMIGVVLSVAAILLALWARTPDAPPVTSVVASAS